MSPCWYKCLNEWGKRQVSLIKELLYVVTPSSRWYVLTPFHLSAPPPQEWIMLSDLLSKSRIWDELSNFIARNLILNSPLIKVDTRHKLLTERTTDMWWEWHITTVILFLSQTHNLSLTMRNNWDKIKLRNMLQNTCRYQNCQGYQKQEKIKKSSQIRGD
jgi:hypothetical protein